MTKEEEVVATAKKRDPAKWARAKAKAKAKMGGKHSARAMQLAVKYYKDMGGRYSGKKSSKNKLSKWSKQKWDYVSKGDKKKPRAKRGRYLPEAVRKTLETGKVHFWSRSRQKLWLKGGTSGHIQEVKVIYVDCDLDTVVLRVHQVGGASCHEGYPSCIYRKVEGGKLKTVYTKVFDPKEVYKS